MVKVVHRSNLEGNREVRRQQRRGRDEIKELLMGGGGELSSQRVGILLARNRDAWGGMVNRSE